MTGVLSRRFAMGRSSSLAVTANDVTRATIGLAGSQTVSTTQFPNTTVTGGLSPYTYLWEYVSGDETININNALAMNPTWAALVDAGNSISAVWQVIVTDSVAATASTEITILLAYDSLNGRGLK